MQHVRRRTVEVVSNLINSPIKSNAVPKYPIQTFDTNLPGSNQ